MAGIFDTIITKGVRAGQIPARTDQARNWYRDTAKSFGSTVRKGGKEAGRIDYARISEKQLEKEDPGRLTNSPDIGSMYMYMYDPKGKDTLPYYDKFPLIFPFRIESDSFWGINLHYLPLPLRAKLMDALYDLKSNTRYDESTKLNLSYEILKSAAKYRYFKPCVKQYLFKQMQSNFIYVYPSEWDVALFLPLERFAKASKDQVWADVKKNTLR